MIWLSVNDEKIKLKFETTVIEVRINYIVSQKEGILKINNFKKLNKDNTLSNININKNDKLVLIINELQIRLNSFDVKVNDDGWVSINNKMDDILTLHKSILKQIKDCMVQSLSCFNIFPGCNLKCPYCSQTLAAHSLFDDDFYMYKDLISYDLKTSKNIFKNKKIRYMDRCMGDETLMNWDIFTNRINDIIRNDLYCKNESFEMYTNATKTENIKKLVDWIESEGFKYYKRFELIITVDTLDYKTSLRYNTQKLFDDYMSSLKILSKYVHNKNIDIYFNVMYIDNKTTLNTIKGLSKLGFKYFKIGFNERNNSKEYIDFYSNNSFELYKECSKYMTMVKTRNKYDMIYSFRIYELNKLVFEHKYTFLVGYNAVRYFQSHITRTKKELEDII